MSNFFSNAKSRLNKNRKNKNIRGHRPYPKEKKRKKKRESKDSRKSKSERKIATHGWFRMQITEVVKFNVKLLVLTHEISFRGTN